MARLPLIALLAGAACAAPQPPADSVTAVPQTPTVRAAFGMVVHGGAGTITRGSMTPQVEQQYRAVLEQALLTGYRIIEAGGTSLDAVEATVRIMEDSPLFNAGKGAVFTAEGRNELDASIMDGRTLAAGAVAGVTRVRNPITLARRVMEQSPHVMMAREGAEVFAREQNLELVPESYFFTESRWNSLRTTLQQQGRAMPPRPPGVGGGDDPLAGLLLDDRKFGTVGAVALDRHGNIAAATSTGGMTGKRFGRIGDAPVIGAGTYANPLCGVSATGHGEFFIRNVVAHDICARMEYLNLSIERAAHDVVMDRLVRQQAEGGIIALDVHGNYTMPFNSEGMYRGYIGPDGRANVWIYKD
ncbi:MAG TPA: isoaspartyl peptidase/L-asparaginase [Longimicrobiales bacterium]|nr:isoaspartyl peptidase/L-asparaginase [Longimicrobiales bacterium]